MKFFGEKYFFNAERKKIVKIFFGRKKFFGETSFFSLKNFWLKKIVGEKSFLVKKKVFFGEKAFLVKKRFW